MNATAFLERVRRRSAEEIAGRAMHSPLSMPERTVGGFSITHDVYEAGRYIDVVDMREALLTGQRPLSVMLSYAKTVHRLVDNKGGCLMSDHPMEMRAMGSFADDAHGRVLIGGLGLGILTRLVLDRPEVESVEVVELEPDIIELVGNDLGPKVRVIHANLYAFLRKRSRWRWESAFFDTWYPTSEGTWLEEAAPLRRIARRRFGTQRIRCWAEEMMVGQIVKSLAFEAALGLSVERCWHDGHKTFRAATLDRWPVLPEVASNDPERLARAQRGVELMGDEAFREEAVAFATDIGSPEWEERFGARWPLTAPRIARRHRK